MAIINYNPSVFNMSVRHLGRVTEVFTSALTDDIRTADGLKAVTSSEDGSPIEKRRNEYSVNSRLAPAGGLGTSDNELHVCGIGYWAIGVDFIVSGTDLCGIGYWAIDIDFIVT